MNTLSPVAASKVSEAIRISRPTLITYWSIAMFASPDVVATEICVVEGTPLMRKYPPVAVPTPVT